MKNKPVTRIVLTLFIAGTLWAQAKDPRQKTEASFEPTSQFKEVDIEGWTVFVNKRLYGERKEIGARVLRQLEVQLYEVSRLVPEKQLAEMRKVKIWMDDRKSGPAQYHPDRGWLVRNNYNPDKVRCVDIGNPEGLLREYKRQPYVMLHELAHGYHHQVLGFDEKRVVEAYEEAKKSGKYKKVLTWWEVHREHYGMSNHKEYFAEMTEAYLAQNDFYPFMKAELKEYDRKMYDLMKDIWAD